MQPTHGQTPAGSHTPPMSEATTVPDSAVATPPSPPAPQSQPGLRDASQDVPHVELPPHYIEQQELARRQPSTAVATRPAGRPNRAATAALTPADDVAPPIGPASVKKHTHQRSETLQERVAGRGIEQQRPPGCSPRAMASQEQSRRVGQRKCSPRGAGSPAAAHQPLPRAARPGSCPPIGLPPVRLGPPPPPPRAPLSSAMPAVGSGGGANGQRQQQQRRLQPPEPRFSPLPPVPGGGGGMPYLLPAPAPTTAPPHAVAGFQQSAARQQPWLGLDGSGDGMFAAGPMPAAQIPTVPLFGPGACPVHGKV